MTTTNSSWLTSTNEEYYEVPLKSLNSPVVIPFSITIADGSMDAIGDVVNIYKLPQTAKLGLIYFELADHDDGGQTDIDFQITETTGGTTTTTILYNGATLGQTAVTGQYILPAVSSSYLHEGIPTDDGTATLRLYQNATVTTDKATTLKGWFSYL